MKDKLLNFLIIFLLVYLTLSLFQVKDKENKLSGNIVLKTSETYTIPVRVKIEIKNETSNRFTFNTCSDFSIKKDSNIIKQTDCKNVSIPSWTWYIIDFSNDYSLFKEAWKYFVNLKKGDIDVISQFDVKNRGFIGKIFIFFFYAPIYNLMVFLLKITWYSLWWAIVIITIIIRLILLIPQHKMMVSQAKMQKIQPKIKEIQEKYKGDHQTLWMELMKLYKDEKVNPMWSCWLLLIQMPILIVIYNVIISIKNVSNTYYLYSFLWDYEISYINPNFFWIDLFWIGWINWLILAIIIWLLQYLQVKMSLIYNEQNNKKNWIVLEKKKNINDSSEFMPDPELLNKFMLYWMPIMIALVTYTFFAWVWIYWWIWTIFVILQQLFVNKILKK
jgi:YidC/Oxa1 family membrane protein insertase